MSRIRFKLAVLAAAATLVLALTSARGDKRFLLARYKQSNLGATCQPPIQLPATCTAVVTGTICSTPFGSATRTWYQDICVTPYYYLGE